MGRSSARTAEVVEVTGSCKLYLPPGKSPSDLRKHKKKKTTSTGGDAVSTEELMRSCTRISNSAKLTECENFVSEIPNETNLEPEIAIAEKVFRISCERLAKMSVSVPGVPALLHRQKAVVLLKVNVGSHDSAAGRFAEKLTEFHQNNAPGGVVIGLDAGNITSLGDVCIAATRSDTILPAASSGTDGHDRLDSLLSSLSSRFQTHPEKEPPKKKKKSLPSSSSGVTVLFRNAELLEAEILENLAYVCYNSGVPCAVVMLFSSPVCCLHSLFPSSYVGVSEEYVTGDHSENQLDTSIREFVFREDIPFILGPNVVDFLVRRVYLSSYSPGFLWTAMKCTYLFHFMNDFTSLKLSKDAREDSETYEHLRNSSSFLQYLKAQDAATQIELLLDDKSLYQFAKKTRAVHQAYRKNVKMLTEVIADILAPLETVRWWDVYVMVVSGQPWQDFPPLQVSSANLDETLTASLKNQEKFLQKCSDDGDLVAALAKLLHDHRKAHHTGNEKQAVESWRTQSRKGSPLIPLLQEMCSLIKPWQALVFHESFVFDDVDSLENLILPNVKQNIEDTLVDPEILFKSHWMDDSSSFGCLARPNLQYR